MIVLDKNELTFEAASADAALADCTVHFAQQWLPRILAPKPLVVLKRLLATDYCRLSAEQRKTVTRVVSRLTPDHLAAEFTRQLSGNVKAHKARVSIDFHRTLRLPDDGQVYLLPSGIGRFPLRPVDLCAKHLPASWIARGGLLIPMYQAEALWLGFNNRYPWALKVGEGPINALNGRPWQPGLHRHPQDYLVLPEHPWLEGFCSEKGSIRQFVAAPLGTGSTVWEQVQLTHCGGLQLEAFPLKPQVYFKKRLQTFLPQSCARVIAGVIRRIVGGGVRINLPDPDTYAGMGIAVEGRMGWDVCKDPWEPTDWDLTSPSRVWIHFCDVIRWFQITGELPPYPPITARDYARHRLPWFDYYRDDLAVIEGSPALAKLKSVVALASEKHDDSITEEETPPMTAEGRRLLARIYGAWDGK